MKTQMEACLAYLYLQVKKRLPRARDGVFHSAAAETRSSFVCQAPHEKKIRGEFSCNRKNNVPWGEKQFSIHTSLSAALTLYFYYFNVKIKNKTKENQSIARILQGFLCSEAVCSYRQQQKCSQHTSGGGGG